MKPCCKEYLSKQFGGDQAVVEDIYAEYRKEVGGMLGELPGAMSRGEWELVDRLVHTLKGNSLAVGDAETAEVAIAMREAVKLGDKDRAEECLARIRELAEGL
ncbi:MAG: Hpt domain-containing protein [Kiritimatiellae bacterium]|nr:Hpt domain-containing protein [Kiritimatiellia bacterium]